MKIHTCIVSYNRLDLTKRAIQSYLETVNIPFTLVVVDNNSEKEVQRWLMKEYDHSIILLNENRYPGYATNRGWEMAPTDANYLHRADNDFEFLPGWCQEVKRRFNNQKLGLLGLRTDAEEQWAWGNVGGNCIIRRSLWDDGLRWDERPWPQLVAEVGDGHSEDSLFAPAVSKMGWGWGRVRRRCIANLASGDLQDPYYADSYGARRIFLNE